MVAAVSKELQKNPAMRAPWQLFQNRRVAGRHVSSHEVLFPTFSCHQLIVVLPVTRSIDPSTVKGFDFRPRTRGACCAVKEIKVLVTLEMGMM